MFSYLRLPTLLVKLAFLQIKKELKWNKKTWSLLSMSYRISLYCFQLSPPYSKTKTQSTFFKSKTVLKSHQYPQKQKTFFWPFKILMLASMLYIFEGHISRGRKSWQFKIFSFSSFLWMLTNAQNIFWIGNSAVQLCKKWLCQYGPQILIINRTRTGNRQWETTRHTLPAEKNVHLVCA